MQKKNQCREFDLRCPPFPPATPFPPLGGAVASLDERTQAAAPPPPYPAQDDGCDGSTPPLPAADDPKSARRPAPSGGATAGDSLKCLALLQPEVWFSAASSSPEDMSVSIEAREVRRDGRSLPVAVPPPLAPDNGLRFIREPEPAKMGLTTEARFEAGGARRVIVGRESDRVTAASSPRSSSTSSPAVASVSEPKPHRTMSRSRLAVNAE